MCLVRPAAAVCCLLLLQFTAYMKEIKAQEQEAARLDAVFPCILEVSGVRGPLETAAVMQEAALLKC